MRHGGDDLNRIAIPAAERDRMIWELRRKGWTYKRISKRGDVRERRGVLAPEDARGQARAGTTLKTEQNCPDLDSLQLLNRLSPKGFGEVSGSRSALAPGEIF